MTKATRHLRTYATFLLLEWGFYVLLWLPILYYVSTTDSLWEEKLLLSDALTCLPVAAANVILSVKLEKRLSSKDSPYSLIRNIAIILGSNLALSIPASFLEIAIYDWLSIDSLWDWSGEYINAYGLCFIAAFVTSSHLLIVFTAKSRKEGEKILHKEKELSEARLHMLSNQINPHFLSNNISAGIGLITTEPEVATEYFSTMSAVYRQMLQNSKNSLIPLQEELNYLDKYLYLMKIRFGESFVFKSNGCNQPLNGSYIIPGAAQMICENIFKHNSLSDEKPLSIELYITDDRLKIKNDYRPLKPTIHSTGTGIGNIKNRYGNLGMTVCIENDGSKFSVSIPLFANPVNTMSS